jgi:hypothetical protein
MPRQAATMQRVLACPECTGEEFAISLLKDDGVGVAKCGGCARDYLLFDSADYWFDVIQQRYPRTRVCSCKGSAFRLRGDYWMREDGDIHTIQLWSTCAQCAKAKRELTLDIDYSPTQSLLDQPLVHCAKPKLLYDVKDLGLYATPERIAGVVRYLHEHERCTYVGVLRESRQWVRRTLDGPTAIATVLCAEAPDGLSSFLWIYALPTPLDVPPEAVATAKQEDGFWKRNDVIRIGSPMQVIWGGERTKLYAIQFANERVDGDAVQPKSQAFRAATGRLMQWLAKEFVSWRGPSSFDDPVVHAQAFGDRFTRKKR